MARRYFIYKVHKLNNKCLDKLNLSIFCYLVHAILLLRILLFEKF